VPRFNLEFAGHLKQIVFVSPSGREPSRVATPPMVTATNLLFYLVAYVLNGIAHLPTRFADTFFDLTGCFVRYAFVVQSVVVGKITYPLFDTALQCIGLTVEFVFVHVSLHLIASAH
jgi:hypothetical protein